MFSAQKQEMPSDTPPETSRPPTVTGFGKVLNSIQGLQQRLDDFSVEEVSRAQSQAQELIREFGVLQAQLNALAKLKEAVASAKAEIAALPDENFDLVGPDSLENHPQLRAIVQAAKLIRMHRLLRAARASADSVSFENSEGVAGIDLSKEIAAPSQRVPIVPRADNVIPPAIDTAAENKIASDKTEADASSLPEDQSLTPATSSAAPQSEPATKYEFAALKLDETHERIFPEKNDFSEAAMADKHLPTPPKDKKPSEKSRFNERLLSDVIETYGEFALIPSPPIPVESAQIAPPAPLTSTDLMPVPSAPVEPGLLQSKSGASLGPPMAATKERQPISKAPPPSAKSRVEIDRQLKSIIKDYGEYDLYSHQKSLNIKAAAIAAVIVLALIVGGLYFFKTSPSPAPVTLEATMPSGRTTQEIEKPSVTRNLNETK
jgi:hypothetical protein